MHRDIKLENIMFAEKKNLNSLKIVNFSFATFKDDIPYVIPRYSY